MDELGQIDLVISRGLTTGAGHISQGHRQLGDLGDDLIRQGHEVAQRCADDVVQGDQDGEGQEGPQAPGHGVDALAGIEVRDLLLLLFFVIGVFLLDLLHLAVHAAHAEHTLLALELEGKQHQLDDQGEEDQSDAVRARPGIEQAGEPRERHTDVVAELCKHRLLFLRSFLRGVGSGHRIIPAALVMVEGMAPHKTLEGQPAALGRTVFLDRLKGVLRAGGDIAAAGREQGRDGPAIKADSGEKKSFHTSSRSNPSSARQRRYCFSSL